MFQPFVCEVSGDVPEKGFSSMHLKEGLPVKKEDESLKLGYLQVIPVKKEGEKKTAFEGIIHLKEKKIETAITLLGSHKGGSVLRVLVKPL